MTVKIVPNGSNELPKNLLGKLVSISIMMRSRCPGDEENTFGSTQTDKSSQETSLSHFVRDFQVFRAQNVEGTPADS